MTQLCKLCNLYPFMFIIYGQDGSTFCVHVFNAFQSLELRDLYAGAFLVANGGQEKAVYSLSVATALSFTSC